MTTNKDIEDARYNVERMEHAVLRERGWKYTSDIACLWLWHKELKGRVVAVDTRTAIAIENYLTPNDDPSDE